MFEFIIHYKDGTHVRRVFGSETEMFDAVIEHSEQPINISESWAEFGRVTVI